MNFTPGFIKVLHTFGRDLKWTPHILCSISEGGYSNNGFWRRTIHFNYTFLRNAFRSALLNEMETKLGPSFKKVKARCYRKYKDGFYVYAKPNTYNPKTAIKYIGCYLGHPVIDTSHIDSYDVIFSLSIIAVMKITNMWKNHSGYGIYPSPDPAYLGKVSEDEPLRRHLCQAPGNRQKTSQLHLP